ncbi:hypothetical protein [Candidatus Protochlamydia phocaeensis]|uniref:hypothetical protein n=1 Tax=Candidatus Protochlamydia phocaeensis TaxID=1414722 RepID=UPI000839983B|nr:hypothetical protein [Candidatus Protochlamydia phocaeensis]
MWFKEYRDYKIDKPLIKEKVEPGHGIIGCEMHDLNGWGIENHRMRPKKRGFFAALLAQLFGDKRGHG